MEFFVDSAVGRDIRLAGAFGRAARRAIFCWVRPDPPLALWEVKRHNLGRNSPAPAQPRKPKISVLGTGISPRSSSGAVHCVFLGKEGDGVTDGKRCRHCTVEQRLSARTSAVNVQFKNLALCQAHGLESSEGSPFEMGGVVSGIATSPSWITRCSVAV